MSTQPSLWHCLMICICQEEEMLKLSKNEAICKVNTRPSSLLKLTQKEQEVNREIAKQLVDPSKVSESRSVPHIARKRLIHTWTAIKTRFLSSDTSLEAIGNTNHQNHPGEDPGLFLTLEEQIAAAKIQQKFKSIIQRKREHAGKREFGTKKTLFDQAIVSASATPHGGD